MEDKKPIKNKKQRKPRTKKPVDFSIDTKNVDIDFKRDEEGNVELDIDTKKFDAKFTKVDGKVSLGVDIDDDGIYDLVANGEADFMKRNQVWSVTGKVLKQWLKSKFGKLKK